jgi:hypothetical protein
LPDNSSSSSNTTDVVATAKYSLTVVS